jgi:hypothetical protein
MVKTPVEMVAIIRAIEEYYIKQFANAVALEDFEDEGDLVDFLTEFDMTWSRVGMLLELGFDIDTTDCVVEPTNDPQKYIEMQIDAERALISDSKLLALLSDVSSDSFLAKAFKACSLNDDLVDKIGLN